MTVLQMGKIKLPDPILSATAWGALQTTISGNNDAFAFVTQAPATGTIDKIVFWIHAQTTGGTIDVRLETVDDTTGNPSGSLLGTNTNASFALTGAATECIITLTAGASVTKGDRFAVVLKNPASSPPNYSIKTSGELVGYGFPYADKLVTGSWTKASSDMALAVHYSDNGGSYIGLNSGHAISAATAPTTVTAFQSGSNPNRMGNKFIAAAAFRVTGAWARITNAANANWIMELYDSSNNVVASYTHDGTDRKATSTNLDYFEFTSNVILVPGATYRIAIRATAAVNVQIDYQTSSSAALLGAAIGSGIYTRTYSGDGSNWTDVSTDVMHIGIIADGVDIPENNRSYSA